VGKVERSAQSQVDVVEIAEILTNFGDAIKSRDGKGMTIEEYKNRFRDGGLDGLKGVAPLRKSRPRVTSKITIERIIELSLTHPAWGCIRLSRALKELGISISPPTVQSVLNKNNLRYKHERAMRLEEKMAGERQRLTAEQLRTIETNNPCFRERESESVRPGELLVQDTFFIGDYQGIGKLYLQMVIDTYNSYAFCLIHVGKSSDYAVALLHNEVIPFYESRGLRVEAILTDNGLEYCGKGRHHFELYLMLNDIVHRRLRLRQAQTNGFIQRFRNTVLREFFLKKSRNHPDELPALQRELGSWLEDYNRRSALRGYRNFGKPPEQMLREYLNR
jgi:transposase InsO family protein